MRKRKIISVILLITGIFCFVFKNWVFTLLVGKGFIESLPLVRNILLFILPLFVLFLLMQNDRNSAAFGIVVADVFVGVGSLLYGSFATEDVGGILGAGFFYITTAVLIWAEMRIEERYRIRKWKEWSLSQ